MNRRGIVTVPVEMSRKLWGVEVSSVDGILGGKLRTSAATLVRNYELRGERFVAVEGVHVYGPFPSAENVIPMLDPEVMTVTRELQHQLITDKAESGFASYLLNAEFRVPERVLTGVL